ncbi:MAG: hypothetical protein SGPRY_006581 [Prymnesium sp.]
MEYDPQARLEPHEALRHPFFSPLFPFRWLPSGLADCKGLPPPHGSCSETGKGTLRNGTPVDTSGRVLFTKRERDW